MKHIHRLRLKSIVAFWMSTILLVGLTGCCNKPYRYVSQVEEQQPETFTAYCKPVTSNDVAVEGDIHYADSRIVLTAVEQTTYADIERLMRGYGGEIVGYISDTGDYQIYVPECDTFQKLERLVETLKTHASITDVSVEYVAQVSNDAVAYKNDAWTNSDKESDKSGSEWDEAKPVGNNWWAEAIGMPSVWEKDLSLNTVKVGIIDTMFDITNKDLDEGLFEKVWNNPKDENGNCHVAQIYKEDPAGVAAHGTHVAGVIAAQANNAFGITGINQNVRLYGFAVSTEEAKQSEAKQWTGAFQYKYALAQMFHEGVKVINISMAWEDELVGTQEGDPADTAFTFATSQALESFLLKYIEKGHEFLIVKTAGNNSSSKKKYDAEYDVFGAIKNKQVADRILIVGAAYYDKTVDCYFETPFSNSGDRVDVYAPGYQVLSTAPANRTVMMDGTSMAAPMVTGVASLMWGINPNLSAKQVRSFIMASTSATAFNLDDVGIIIKGLFNPAENAVPIINANLCVQLAQATEGKGASSNAEYATVSGIVYMMSADKKTVTDMESEKAKLSLYNAAGDWVCDIDLQEDLLPREGTNPKETVKVCTYTQLLEPGTYTLKVQAEGCGTVEQSITTYPNQLYSVHFELTKTVPTSTTTQKTEPPKATPSIKKYIPVIKDLLTQMNSDYTGSGFLYDLDSDGVEALVVLNLYNYEFAYSIYDLVGDKVITKCDKKTLFYDAGSPKGRVSVAKYLGELVLVVYVDNGGTGPEAERSATHTVYNANTFQEIASSNRDYQTPPSTKKAVYTINGRTCSDKEYTQFIQDISPIITAEIRDNDAGDGSKNMHELVQYMEQSAK
ncbi:MAG: S8 family serine peptidase [Clostridia bacterium]|nr:S8 family serine peptidase [Clostridia bacterium]